VPAMEGPFLFHALTVHMKRMSSLHFVRVVERLAIYVVIYGPPKFGVKMAVVAARHASVNPRSWCLAACPVNRESWCPPASRPPNQVVARQRRWGRNAVDHCCQVQCVCVCVCAVCVQKCESGGGEWRWGGRWQPPALCGVSPSFPASSSLSSLARLVLVFWAACVYRTGIGGAGGGGVWCVWGRRAVGVWAILSIENCDCAYRGERPCCCLPTRLVSSRCKPGSVGAGAGEAGAIGGSLRGSVVAGIGCGQK